MNKLVSNAVVTSSLFFLSFSSGQTANVQLNSSDVTRELAAVVIAPNTAVLSSQAEGLIEEINVREGDSFAKGDVLLSLNCTLQNAAFSKAQAHYKYAHQDYKSIKALAKLNSASEMQIALARSEFNKAQADLDTFAYQVEQCTVKAPFDGSVIKRWVNPHEQLEAKGKLFEIVNNSELVAEFLAPSTILSSLEAGKEFELKVNETQQSYKAAIHRIVPHIDSVSQTIKVIGTFDTAHPELWSGMSGWVVIP